MSTSKELWRGLAKKIIELGEHLGVKKSPWSFEYLKTVDLVVECDDILKGILEEYGNKDTVLTYPVLLNNTCDCGQRLVSILEIREKGQTTVCRVIWCPGCGNASIERFSCGNPYSCGTYKVNEKGSSGVILSDKDAEEVGTYPFQE